MAVDVLVELVLRDHAATMTQEIGDQPVFQRRQRDRHAAHADLHLAFVERDVAGDHHGRRVAGGAAHDRAQARQQFLHAEGLRQVIVGAGVDAVDALGPTATRGQDQHRHGAAVGAPALEHGEAIHARQAEIEDDGAVVLGVAQEPGFFAVARGLDHIAGGLQRALDVGRDPPVVFDKQQAHYFSLTCSILPLRAST